MCFSDQKVFTKRQWERLEFCNVTVPRIVTPHLSVMISENIKSWTYEI
jgi:hypothetical protein